MLMSRDIYSCYYAFFSSIKSLAKQCTPKRSQLFCFHLVTIRGFRVQRKSFLQLAIQASWSYHLLAQTSFQLAPKTFWLAELISQFFCYSNSSKNITCPSGKLKTEFTSLIAKSTSPGLSDTTFFAHWVSISSDDWRNMSATLLIELGYFSLDGRRN